MRKLGHSLGSHTRHGTSSSGSRGSLPKGMSNKSRAWNQCSCMTYKDKSKGGTASPILTHQSFFYYSQTPAYFVEEPTTASESEDNDNSSSYQDQQHEDQ